jgi:hypothetical protein
VLTNYKRLLLKAYQKKYGPQESLFRFSKSHWPDCAYAANATAPIMMPDSTPHPLISCNGCLFRKQYMIAVRCNPNRPDWLSPDNDCELCAYGWDCQTWLRVSGAGEAVEAILQTVWPEADHPVTWGDTGLVPFLSEEQNSLRFPTQSDLLRFRNSIPPSAIIIDHTTAPQIAREVKTEGNCSELVRRIGGTWCAGGWR